MKTLSETLAGYFTHFRTAVAPAMSLPKPQFVLRTMVWHYILSLSGRLDRLIARWKNGTLPKPGAPRPGRVRATTRNPPRVPLPSGKNWLSPRMPGTGIGAFGGQLRYLLANDAELAAFLAAAPQARRMLGPLCRAFGIDMQNPLVIPPARPAAKMRPKAEPPVIPPPAPPPPVESPSRSSIPIPHPFVAFLRR